MVEEETIEEVSESKESFLWLMAAEEELEAEEEEEEVVEGAGREQ